MNDGVPGEQGGRRLRGSWDLFGGAGPHLGRGRRKNGRTPNREHTRLSTPFRWLWAGATASNLGDGMVLAAGPLLVASLSRDPLAVALAVFVQQLPWVLFGLLAGAVIDRIDRRLLMVFVNLARSLVMAGIAVVIFTGLINLPLLYLGLFLLGTAETFADNAATSLIPNLVPSPQLGLANSRLFGTVTVTNQLAGPPLGALLFGLAHGLPYAGYAGLLGVAAVLYSRIRMPLPGGPGGGIDAGPGGTAGAVPEQGTVGRSMLREISEGMGWLGRHFAVRTLAMLIAFFNITYGGTFAMLVLYATAQLGLDGIGYGLLISSGAVGGMAGAVVFPWLERRLSYATLMRVGLVLETLTHLVLVLTHRTGIAMAMLFVFGVHSLVWSSVSSTVRQRAVPDQLRGRVNSVYMLGGVAGMAAGSLLGGFMGRLWGFQAPFWFGFAGSLLILVLVWKPIRHIAQAGAPAAEGAAEDKPSDEPGDDASEDTVAGPTADGDAPGTR
jgi:MFS family permease